LPAGALAVSSDDDALTRVVDHLAGITVGFTGADLANVVNEAALLAARRGAAAIGAEELNEAVERASSGLERPSLRLSASERRTVALHESGHAVLAHLARDVARISVTKVSVIPRSQGALGWTQATPDGDTYLACAPSLRAMMAVLLAGRAAERVMCGVLTSGAADDLLRATRLATDYVAAYGMSTALGPRAVGAAMYGVGAGSDGGATSGLRPPGLVLAAKVDDAVDELLTGADAWATACVSHNAGVITALADALARDDTLAGAPLLALLRGATLPHGEAPFWDGGGEAGASAR
jgi:cell division protease FtsH